MLRVVSAMNCKTPISVPCYHVSMSDTQGSASNGPGPDRADILRKIRRAKIVSAVCAALILYGFAAAMLTANDKEGIGAAYSVGLALVPAVLVLMAALFRILTLKTFLNDADKGDNSNPNVS